MKVKSIWSLKPFRIYTSGKGNLVLYRKGTFHNLKLLQRISPQLHFSFFCFFFCDFFFLLQICALPSEQGLCKARIDRFFFDPKVCLFLLFVLISYFLFVFIFYFLFVLFWSKGLFVFLTCYHQQLIIMK